jgi:hypothetical protein
MAFPASTCRNERYLHQPLLPAAMLIDQVFFYFLIAVGVVISMPALWLLMRARWPQRVEKLRQVSDRSVLLSFLCGLPVLPVIIGLLFFIGFLGKRGDIVLVFFVGFLVTTMAVAALGGLAGLATLIGERLSSDKSPESWKATLRGGVVLVFIFSMPYVGWFALLPMGILTGAGLFLRSFFVRSSQSAPAFAPSPAAPPLPAQTPAPIL